MLEPSELPAGVEMRVAAPSELEEVLALFAAEGLSAPAEAECFPDGLVVAREEESGTLLGAALLEIHGAEGLLRSVVVVPERRGCGIGRALALATVDLARVAGVRELQVRVREREEFFLRHGWERVESEPEDALAALRLRLS